MRKPLRLFGIREAVRVTFAKSVDWQAFHAWRRALPLLPATVEATHPGSMYIVDAGMSAEQMRKGMNEKTLKAFRHPRGGARDVREERGLAGVPCVAACAAAAAGDSRGYT